MIKILHVVHSLNDGGIERLLLEICKGIDKTKFEVQICCLVEVGNLAPEFEKLNIKLHFLNSKRTFSFKNIFVNVSKLLELKRIIKSEQINITHGHEFYPTVFSRISAILAGVKYRYITLHNMYYWWDFWVHLTQYILSFVTTKIVCNSYSTLDYSLANDKIRKEKYVVIYNGIDCDKFTVLSSNKKGFLQKLNVPFRDIVFISIGNVSPRKGYEFSIKAINCLKEEYKSIVYLIVGGKHHQEVGEYEKLLKIIKDNSLEELVYITGRVNNVKDYLDVCDIYLMPSVAEGFGISLVEAMSMNKIVVASDIAPFKEIIDEGLNGFIFKSQSYQSLAEKIIEVNGTDCNKLNDIRKKAREKVLSNFDSKRMVDEYSKLYFENFK